MKTKIALALATLGLSATAALSIAGNSIKLIDKNTDTAWIKATNSISCEDWKSWEGVDTATVKLDLTVVPENDHVSVLGATLLTADVTGKTCADVNTATLLGTLDNDYAKVELTRVINKVIEDNTYLGCKSRLLEEQLSVKLESGLVLTGWNSRQLARNCKQWN